MGLKKLFSLSKSKAQKHAILDEKQLEQKNTLINQNTPNNNSSVWPADSNIIIERVAYKKDLLEVHLTNLHIDPIKIIATGVKYSSNDSESIDFKETNITIPSGESKIKIFSPNGKPFKFVIRTSNGTGAGAIIDDFKW